MTPMREPAYLEDAKEGRDRADQLQLRDPLARPLEAHVGGGMRRDDQLGGLLLDPRVLLDEAGNAHALFREHLADGGNDAGAILRTDAVVGARLDLAHRDDTDAVVERKRRA